MEDKLSIFLDSLVGRRFEHIDDIVNTICLQNGFFRGHLVEDNEQKDHIADNLLIGSVETVYKQEFDIQLWYIKDNFGNYYITETIVLGEV